MIGCNHYADGSCPTIAAENCDEKTPELSPVLQNDFVRQATEIKEVESGIIFSIVEDGSSPGATLRLEDQSNNSFPVSSCNVLKFCYLFAVLDIKKCLLTPHYPLSK